MDEQAAVVIRGARPFDARVPIAGSPEHPGLHEYELHRRRHRRGHRDHARFDERRRVEGQPVEQRERPRGHRPGQEEHGEPLHLVPGRARPLPHPECPAPVRRRVDDRGETERDDVGQLRRPGLPEQRKQTQVHHGRPESDEREEQRLPPQPAAPGDTGERAVSSRHTGRYAAPTRPAAARLRLLRLRRCRRHPAPDPGRNIRRRQGAPGEGPAQSPHPPQVLQRGRDDVDAAVRVVAPVDWHLVNAQVTAFGEGEQFGVEEPRRVLDERQQFGGHVGPDRLEPALGVAEMHPEGAPQQQVVGP